MTATASTSLDEYREQARAWLAENLEPKPAGADAAAITALRGMHEFTKEQIDAERPKQKLLYEAGYAGITWPTEFGGQGMSPAHERTFLEEAAGYELPNFGIAGGTTFGVCAQVMLAHASDDFKRRHLPRMLAGDELWVQFFSEPVAGSDLAGVQTRAVRDGDAWVLNGAKVWSSWAHLADWGLCLARTNWSVPKHRGLTWFGVPVDADGVTLRVIRQINGGADFCEEFFDDVVINDDERIGDVDGGWTVARTMLVFERGVRAVEIPDTPVEPGPLAPDLAQLARAVGRAGRPRGPPAGRTRARARLPVPGGQSPARDPHEAVRWRRRRCRVREARARDVRLRAGDDRHGHRARRRDRLGRRRRPGCVDRADLPQREDQLDRRRDRPDATQRHQ